MTTPEWAAVLATAAGCYLLKLAGLLVPELRRRGRRPAHARPGTLREKLSGGGPRVADSHAAAAFRPTEDPRRGNTA